MMKLLLINRNNIINLTEIKVLFTYFIYSPFQIAIYIIYFWNN